MEATRVMTFGSSLNKDPQEYRKTRKRVLIKCKFIETNAFE